nr:Ig-like domain-containing protein [Archangium violaceum]
MFHRSGVFSNGCAPYSGYTIDHDDLVFAVSQEADLTPPSVTITSPVEGSVVSRGVHMRVAASDDFAVQRVELYAGTTLLATDTEAPFEKYWPTQSLADGPYTLTARAYDAAGNMSQSTVNVTVDNDFTPPSEPVLTAPAAGALLSGTVTLEASASDDREVKQVDFFLDGALLGSDATAPFSFTWDTGTAFNGSHTLSVQAYDAAGQSALSAPVTVETINAGNARYDPLLGAPRCDTVMERCDARELVQGRGADSERNAPNTLDGCPDGTKSGLAENIRGIRVLGADGTALTAGKRVRVEVDVVTDNKDSVPVDRLVVYSAADATQPSWVPIATVRPLKVGVQTLLVEYVLPAGGLQAVRAKYGVGTGSATACGVTTPENYWIDHDDLVFPVGTGTDTAPPQVALTAPGNGETLTGAVTVSAMASDDFGVAAVDFYDGSTLIGTDSTEPFGVMWNTRSVANGSHTLVARTRDVAGHEVASLPVTVTTDNDFVAPEVSLTSVSPGTRVAVKQQVWIYANATDNVGVTRVEFFQGGSSYPFDTAYSVDNTFRVQTSFSYTGQYVLTARAYDAVGNVGTSQQMTVMVVTETTPPAVSLTAPASGATLSGTVTLSANATDASSSISKVEFLVDGTLIATDTSWPYSLSWNTLTVASGSHMLTARATDAQGNVATSTPVSVTVDNAAPAVALTSPASGATLEGVISLQAEASDDVGVTRVEFLRDGLLVGSDTTAPFGVDWDSTTEADGSHTLTARAYDAANKVTTSAAVTVTTSQIPSAVYDATLRVPKCATPVDVCDTKNLVTSQYTSEPHRPNTLNGSCSDGITTAYAIQRIKLSSVEGGPFTAGQRVRLEVHASIYSAAAASIDLFSASDATQPVWTHLTTLPTTPGSQVLSAEYVLPSGHLQAVRAQLRLDGDPMSACTLSGYGEHDDVAFAVLADPVLTLTAPSNGAQLKGLVPMTATVTAASPVTKVEFFADGTLLGTDTSAPYELSWDSATGADGAHALTAKAHDTEGRVGTSPAITVNIDNTLPDVALTSPAPGVYLGSSAMLEATATDNQTVSKVEFYVDGALLGTDTSAPYTVSWNAGSWTQGAHTLTARAHDGTGNVRTSAGVQVTVDTLAPTVSITAPAQSARLRGTVQISANASDSVGVARVEFYVDGALMGTDTSAPYAVSWDSVGRGGRGPHVHRQGLRSREPHPALRRGLGDARQYAAGRGARLPRPWDVPPGRGPGRGLRQRRRGRHEGRVLRGHDAARHRHHRALPGELEHGGHDGWGPHAHGEGVRQHRQRAQLHRGPGDGRQHRAGDGRQRSGPGRPAEGHRPRQRHRQRRRGRGAGRVLRGHDTARHVHHRALRGELGHDRRGQRKRHAHHEGLRRGGQCHNVRRPHRDRGQQRAHGGHHLAGQRDVVLLPHLQHHDPGQRQRQRGRHPGGVLRRRHRPGHRHHGSLQLQLEPAGRGQGQPHPHGQGP